MTDGNHFDPFDQRMRRAHVLDYRLYGNSWDVYRNHVEHPRDPFAFYGYLKFWNEV